MSIDADRKLPAPFISRVASDMVGLRELSAGGELPLPLSAGAAAALRGRLRRLRASLVDRHADASTQALQLARRAVRPFDFIRVI
eukprot:tig00020816_g14146.t1